MCKKVQYICALYSLIGHKEGKCGIQLYGFVCLFYSFALDEKV